MTRRGLRAAAGAVALAAVLAGCSDSGSTSGGTGGAANGYVAGEGTVQVLPVDRRRDPVTLTGTTLDGERLDLATLRGKIAVVNAWGSWCPPCRKEAPELAAAAKELAPQGVAFVGINARDDLAAARAFERKYGVGYPSITDTGRELLAFGGAIPPNAFPTTLVLDERGRVAARFSGPITRTTLKDLVADVRSSAGA